MSPMVALVGLGVGCGSLAAVAEGVRRGEAAPVNSGGIEGCGRWGKRPGRCGDSYCGLELAAGWKETADWASAR